MTQFDFNNITDLGKFWDGGSNASNWGGGQFNMGSMGGKAGVSHNVDLLYQNLIGRNADPSGRQYWIDKIDSGANTYQTLADTLKGSTEYTDQQSYLANNPNATADDLKGISQKSCGILKDMGTGIEWVHSYVTGDKVYCIYNADNEDLIKDHASTGGFPANSISEVKNVISPKTAD